MQQDKNNFQEKKSDQNKESRNPQQSPKDREKKHGCNCG